jgi:cytochrome c2
MKHFSVIILLVVTALLLTTCLFAFTIINEDKFSYEQTPDYEYGVCGTASLEAEDLSDPMAVNGKTLFNNYCKACHRLNQKLVGPALRDVFERRDSVWIRKMIINANKLIARGDTLAVRLFNEYYQTPHTSFEGLSKEDVDALMVYLKTTEQEGGIKKIIPSTIIGCR